MPRISVVIPNWNGAARLRRLLESINCQSERPCEVLVVDNGSTDQSQEAARSLKAEWVPLDRNYGFARAVNVGLRRANGEAIAILNNDITIAPGFLGCLGQALERHAFAAPKILRAADPSFLDGTFDLTSRGFCSWRAGYGQSADLAVFNQPRLISSAPMTASMFQRSLFDQVGFLDESFGSYLEDVDFGIRCGIAHLQGYYEPAAVAWHEGSATLGGEWNASSVKLIARNQAVLARKYGSLWSWPVAVGQLLWGAASLKRGMAWPWIQGKIEGCGLNVIRCDAGKASVQESLRKQEVELAELLLKSGTVDRYWSSYLALAGGRD